MSLIICNAGGSVQTGQRVVRHPRFGFTSEATFDEYGTANCANAAAQTTGSTPLDVLWALPFTAPPHGGVLDRLGAEVTSGASGNLRLGLWANVAGAQDLYPGALLIDSGPIAITVALKTFSLATYVALTPNGLYWLGVVLDTTSTLRRVPVAAVAPTLGTDASVASALNTGVSKTFTYAALPDPFPAGAAYTAGTIPLLRYRFVA